MMFFPFQDYKSGERQVLISFKFSDLYRFLCPPARPMAIISLSAYRSSDLFFYIIDLYIGYIWVHHLIYVFGREDRDGTSVSTILNYFFRSLSNQFCSNSTDIEMIDAQFDIEIDRSISRLIELQFIYRYRSRSTLTKTQVGEPNNLFFKLIRTSNMRRKSISDSFHHSLVPFLPNSVSTFLCFSLSPSQPIPLGLCSQTVGGCGGRVSQTSTENRT